MGRVYKGTFNGKPVKDAENEQGVYFEICVAKSRISYFNKLLEAYEHLAFVVQVDPDQGRLGIHTTKEQLADLKEIIANMPMEVQISLAK